MIVFGSPTGRGHFLPVVVERRRRCKTPRLLVPLSGFPTNDTRTTGLRPEEVRVVPVGHPKRVWRRSPSRGVWAPKSKALAYLPIKRQQLETFQRLSPERQCQNLAVSVCLSYKCHIRSTAGGGGPAPFGEPKRRGLASKSKSLAYLPMKKLRKSSTPLRTRGSTWRLVSHCQTIIASTAPCTSRRMCCPTHRDRSAFFRVQG